METRWRRLAAGCLVMAMIGFIYGWSVFSAPLMDEFGWEPSTLSLTFTLLMWAFCAGGIVGGRLVRRFPARVALWLAAMLTLAAFASTALAARADAPWLLYLTYGVLGGGGVGIAYTAAMGAVMAWFPDRAGLASGLMLLCYCLSTLALSSVAAWLFDAVGWRVAFLALGAGTSAVVALAAAFLRAPRAGEAARAQAQTADADARAAEADGADANGAAGVAAAQAGAAGVAAAPATATSPTAPAGATTAAMLRAPAFWVYAAWMLAVSCIGLAVIGSANQLALGAGAAPAAAVAAVGMLALCNGLGRLAMGVVFDALGAAACTVIDAAALGGALALLGAALGLGSAPLALAGLALAGLGAGATSVIGSGFMATAFGEAHYAENLAILNLTLIPAALAGPLMLNGPLAATGSYLPGLAALAGAAAVAAALGLALQRLQRR